MDRQIHTQLDGTRQVERNDVLGIDIRNAHLCRLGAFLCHVPGTALERIELALDGRIGLPAGHLDGYRNPADRFIAASAMAGNAP